MQKLPSWVRNLRTQPQPQDEEGQGLVEYGLILALIAVVCVTALTALGTNISTLLGGLNTSL